MKTVKEFLSEAYKPNSEDDWVYIERNGKYLGKDSKILGYAKAGAAHKSPSTDKMNKIGADELIRIVDLKKKKGVDHLIKQLGKKFNESLQEGKKDYEVYHNTLTSAITEVMAYIKKNGYEVDQDEVFDVVSTGPKKPSDGVTNRYSLTLYKNDKMQRKAIHFQVYGIGSSKRTPTGRYELNLYIS